MDAPIKSWKPDAIVVDLKSSGPSSAGKRCRTLKVRLHKSNVARLTQWRGGPFLYTIAGNGSLQLTAKFNLNFRLDIRKYRKQIHVDPSEPSGTSLASNDSTGTFSASGSGSGVGETFNWSGSGSLMYFTKNTPITGVCLFCCHTWCDGRQHSSEEQRCLCLRGQCWRSMHDNRSWRAFRCQSSPGSQSTVI